jgi:hypothetical protein
MYYFKDHINLTNNLQDNLYILRQRQLKEAAAWSPSSGGPAVPESAAGTNELKDRMRNIKQSGDRPQSKDYLEMEAEVKRREGPRVDLDPSIKQSSDVKTDKVAGDWVERYAQKFDMDPRKLEAIRRGVIDMDTSGKGEDPISQTQDQVAQRGVEAYDRAKQFVVDMQKRDADKRKPVQPTSGGPDPDVQRGQHNINDPSSPAYDPNADTIDFRQEVKNFSNLFKSPEEFKTGSVNDTGANGLAYGSQNKGGRRGLPTTQEEAMRAQELAQFNVPGGVTIPASKPAAPQSSPRAGGKPMVMMDMDGFPVSTTPPAPSQEDANTFGPPAPVKRTPGGTMVSDAQRAVTDKAAGALKDIIRGGSDWMKKQSMNSPGAGATEPQSFGTSSDDTAPGQPYVVPGSQDWNNMSHDEQNAMVTRAMKNNEAHKFTGGRFTRDQRERQDDPNIDRSRFSTDNGGDPFAADINQRSKLANDVIDRQKQNVTRSMMDAWNSDLDDESSGRPWFWPKVSKTSETPKPAEDTRPTSGRQTIYPGSKSTSGEPSLQDTLNTMIDRMKNNSNLPKQPFRPRFSRRPRSR